MPLTELLKDAEADLVAFGALPGEIRAKIKAGVTELTAIRDEVDAVIGAATTDAKAALAKLKTTAASVESVAAKV